MVIDFVLKNGNIVSHKDIHAADIVVSGGKIVDIIENFEGTTDFAYDLCGKYVLPGLIDVHVHFRDPGYPQKEDFESGSRAAVAGGITTVFDMPNTNPPTTTYEALEKKREKMKNRSFCNYGFYFGVTKDNLEEIKKVQNIAGLKYYMGHSTGEMGIPDIAILEKVFEETNGLVVIHAEDEAIIQKNYEKISAEGPIGPHHHSQIRSKQAAYKSVKDALHRAKKYNHRLHIAHVSCQEELEEILKFKEDDVTFEVTPHHLFLTAEAYKEQRFLVKINPPLREKNDIVALWDAIEAHKVDIIATDHAPHLQTEKIGNYEEVPSGVPGVETMLPLLLDSVNKGRLSIKDIVKMCSYHPAQIFGVHGKGELVVGNDADITIIDRDMKREVKNENLFTKCGWSPFAGWILKGWPVMTFVNGHLVYHDGKIDENFKVGKEIRFYQ